MLGLVIDPSRLVMPLLMLGWREWIGATIFIWGLLHQFHCHKILVSIHFSVIYYFIIWSINGAFTFALKSRNFHVNRRKKEKLKLPTTVIKKIRLKYSYTYL